MKTLAFAALCASLLTIMTGCSQQEDAETLNAAPPPSANAAPPPSPPPGVGSGPQTVKPKVERPNGRSVEPPAL